MAGKVNQQNYCFVGNAMVGKGQHAMRAQRRGCKPNTGLKHLGELPGGRDIRAETKSRRKKEKCQPKRDVG